jgi:Tfp pilus assembly protein PilV
MNENVLARIYNSNYLRSGTRIRRRRILSLTGFTIIEILIGLSLLIVVVGAIFGVSMLIKEYFEDGVALARSQETARTLIEKMIRPVRAGRSFTVSTNGETFTLVNYDGSTDVFQFESNNTISENGDTIGANIYQITDSGGALVDVFTQDEANKLVKINFEIRNPGVLTVDRIVRISTEARLRNETNLSK